MDASEELLGIADSLDGLVQRSESPDITVPIAKLQEAATQIGRSWSGSWVGYQSRVYYDRLQTPPPGAHFSQEWGMERGMFSGGTTGDWVECDFESIVREVYRIAGNPSLDAADRLSEEAKALFESARSNSLSILGSVEIDDKYITKIESEIEALRLMHPGDVVDYLRPKGQFMTRDMVAANQGFTCAPHIQVSSRAFAYQMQARNLADLSKKVRAAGSHLARLGRKQVREHREFGTTVFIGHGRSLLWRELKDFVEDRLTLPSDEFNRVPVAGITNVARLTQMLDEAAVAFLVLTAEDERADGTVQARMNVIHEAGLFQGRLGFTKAIVLLEEGCDEFSNIQGLGQIRFPPGNIKAAFEEVRAVLEREGLIQ